MYLSTEYVKKSLLWLSPLSLSGFYPKQIYPRSYADREGDREAAGSAAVSTDGGKKRKPLEKWAFRGVCPSSSLVRCPVEPYIRLLMSGLWIAVFAVL